MSIGQGDSFRVERIAALSPQQRIERSTGASYSQNRQNRQSPAPEDESEEETEAEDSSPETIEATVAALNATDVIEWSDALRSPDPLPALPPARPAASSSAAEARRLDLTV